ncbi:MAG: amino acid ABC transporter substrate-binding protein [Methylobacteriaceae bacterium]|jgi:glutamate/aspartate transport system substrate-binding protein|nr:amino acid ABC transporter substrate-binding protein [Methylobacteriaceae bacterium]
MRIKAVAWTLPVVAAVLCALAMAPAVSRDTSGNPDREWTGTLKRIKETGVISVGHRELSVPFSYYDENHQVVGYSIDIGDRLIDAVARALGVDKLERKYVLVTSANRIPLLLSGGIDLECGSTTNTTERQKEVAFTYTHFVAANRFVSKKSNNYKKLTDLAGKSVAAITGTPASKQLNTLNTDRELGLIITTVKDASEGFQMVVSGSAAAFVTDSVVLAGLVTNTEIPADYVLSEEALSVAPYACMMRKGEPEFEDLIDESMLTLLRDGTVERLYDKWFMKPIPPDNKILNIPMSRELRGAIDYPTTSGDPKNYLPPGTEDMSGRREGE